MVEPANSIVWPVPPAVPIWPMIAFDSDPHVLRLVLHEALRGEYVLDLRGADAEGERTERPVRRCMRIAADDGHTGQRRTLLRADYVNDALPRVPHTEQLDAVFLRVPGQRIHLRARQRVLDRSAVGRRGYVVVGRRQHR